MSAPASPEPTSDSISTTNSPSNILGQPSAPGSPAITQHDSSAASISSLSTLDEVPAPASPTSAPLPLSSPAASVPAPEASQSSPPSPTASMSSLVEFTQDTEDVQAVISVKVVTERASGDVTTPQPSSPDPNLIEDDEFDELFNDTGSPTRTPSPSTVAHVALPQAPDDKDRDDHDDNWQPQSYDVDEPAHPTKRKRQATPTEDLMTEGDFGEIKPPRKTKKLKVHTDATTEVTEKEKVIPKKVASEPKSGVKSGRVEKKSAAVKKPSPGQLWKDKTLGSLLDTIAQNEHKRLLKNAAVNKHFKEMSRWDYIKVERGAATVKDHQIKINKTKSQIAGVAPALGPKINRNRDMGGGKNKFDLQDANSAVSGAKIGAWKGSKWTDENDPSITWFDIPVKQKTLSIPGRMIPIEGIIANPAAYLEFTFKEKIMVENPKTGRQEVGFYRISYEKLSSEETTARGKVMAKQAKAEATQRKKDEAAARRRQKTLGSKSRVRKT